MQMELILVRLGVVKHLHIAALHAHSQPLTRWAVAQRENLYMKWKARWFQNTDKFLIGSGRKETGKNLT